MEKKEKGKKTTKKENVKKGNLKKSEVKEKTPEKKVNKKHNRQLRNILISIGIAALIIVAIVVAGKSATKFTYNGVKFEMVKEGDILFYRTALPTVYQGQLTEYSFYLRNDARKLEVPFNGKLDLKSNAVLNMKSDFNCGGKGVIAVANLLKLYQFIGIKVVGDENATCDPEARYTFIQILEGNETKIEQTGQSCYDIYINNCEILEGTERFMIETFVKVNNVINTPDKK
jgi:hypothetical protein